MGGEDGEAGTSRLVLFRCAESPESNWATAKLGEPALKLRLGCIMRQTRHVKDLAALRQESTDVSPSVHGPGEHIGVSLARLRLTDQPAKNSSQCHSFLHGTARRSRCQSLQMERQIVLNGGTGLHWFDLESSADVGEHRGTEGKRLRVVLLPTLVFGAQIEGTRMLQVGRQYDGLVAGLAGQLYSQVPGIEGDKNEIKVLRGQVLGSESVEAVNCVSEGACITNMLPRQGR